MFIMYSFSFEVWEVAGYKIYLHQDIAGFLEFDNFGEIAEKWYTSNHWFMNPLTKFLVKIGK